MTTTLLECEAILSKEIGDYWAGTTTSTGSATTVIDTALKVKANDWIDGDPGEMYDMITLATDDSYKEERKITSLASGTLTVLDHGAVIGSGVTYRVHRLFSASEKARAVIHSAKLIYPSLFKPIFDETKTLGNWLRNGCVSEWASDDYPDYWRVSGVTAAVNTTAPYYKRGKSAQLSTATGNMYQDLTRCPHFINLAGHSVTFTAQTYCNTDDALRLGILYDGTNITYSDYHDELSAWTKNTEPLSVTETIDDNPTDIAFRVYYADTNATAYVSDLRVTDHTYNKVYIGDLGLAKNKPHGVFREPSDYSQREPWVRMRNWEVDKDGWLHLPSGNSDYRLRIEGIGYLDFIDSDGDVGTDWEDTIALDSPQTEILVAQAIIYLCDQMITPNFSSDHNQSWAANRNNWKRELAERKARFGMKAPPATSHFGV